MADLAAPTCRARPEYERTPLATAGAVVAARPLALGERLWQSALFRRFVLLILLVALWQSYAIWLGNDLMLPTFTATLRALWDAIAHGPLLARIGYSLQVLVMGYGIGVALAGLLVSLAVSTRFGGDILSTLTAMFNPLPAISLLPLAMIWFGLGTPSIVFVVVHSVLWAVTLNTLVGFQSVSETLRMVGQNLGLRGPRYIVGILLRAAFPSILGGLKIGWAFAWRTLIAAELVFGASSRSGGIGWFIFEERSELEIPAVFAGLLTVVVIGLLIESVVFRTIEIRTIRRWGMQR
jgi:NitT/TauT family transport system permease protein